LNQSKVINLIDSKVLLQLYSFKSPHVGPGKNLLENETVHRIFLKIIC